MAACLLAAAAVPILEVNPPPAPAPDALTAIVGATVIDGHGGPPMRDATVLVRGSRIAAVGPRGRVAVPAGAERVDGQGLSILPGLIDSHFHQSGAPDLAAHFLKRGVTSARDPGAWIEAYDSIRARGEPLPRLFLTGPHLDGPPPAHPRNAQIVRDEAEVRGAVRQAVEAGASAIKVYFRLPLGLVEEVVRAANSHGVPTTAHLEIVDGRDAIRAGVGGIEHVTSLGTALVPPREAEAFRQAVLSDNAARNTGRYRLWSNVDPASPQARELIALMLREGTVLIPTLGVFERRAGDPGATEAHLRGFASMLAFTGAALRAGVPVVVGSHATVPHAERGGAYLREMELLVDAGMTPMQAITAGTRTAARHLRVQDRLGTLEPGMAADLLLVEGDPSVDLDALRRVRRVMLNGRWVP